jgi:hypothetical protein
LFLLTEEHVLAVCRARMPFAKCPKVVVFGVEIHCRELASSD